MCNLVMCSVPRTGSTVVWQIMRDLLPEQEIPKVHLDGWEPDGETFIVVTIRDPRDVVSSLYRVRLSRGGKDVDGMLGMETVLHRVVLYFDLLPHTLHNPHVLLRYEDFVDDYDVIFNYLEVALGVKVPAEDRAEIGGRYTVEKNRERAAKLPNFNHIDKDAVHGDHIGPVTPGSWETFLPAWSVGKVRQVCDPIAKEWGYE